tara:strand:- start:1 stop:906 length:906 start_codon:yes stop_codon:yes gene_type:complete
METGEKEYDLFGEEIIKDVVLREKFIEPPFSVLDSKSGNWQKRKNIWKSLGIKGEIGRQAVSIRIGTHNYEEWLEKKDIKETDNKRQHYTSIFDPALCEVIYHWFCPTNGHILDPFSGGSVRGIVANKLGYKYTGIDINEEQIKSNRDQGLDILPINNQPNWYVGDSDILLDGFTKKFDFVFTCPPYFNLEKYTDLDGDLSNKEKYEDFIICYKDIIKKSCSRLKNECYACFVVGEIRDKNGVYLGFVPDTIKIFTELGMQYYNEAIFLTVSASASIRANGNMKSKKLVKTHQNVLIFKKP